MAPVAGLKSTKLSELGDACKLAAQCMRGSPEPPGLPLNHNDNYERLIPAQESRPKPPPPGTGVLG
ncbi:hypothetical protein GALL_103870 [mine drainage metagenome]|uniref:Uncharacterized protein n=1 Tax=mine drainage metagenome TaxID=410659 RepID=A0A1J5T0Q1_9ZZZZ